MNGLKKIYDSSPAMVQNAMVTASGFVKARQRYGVLYKEHRAWLKDFDRWSADQALEYQAEQMRNFISFAVTSSPFYREFYSDLEISKLQTPADLKFLPVMEKEILRKEMENVYTVSSRDSIEGHTGGTTGKSLVIRYRKDDAMRRMAMLDHFKSRHGFENGKMRKATFSGKHIVPRGGESQKFWRYNAAIKQMLYSTFDTSEANLALYVENLNKFKPQALDGFFTSMCAIASYIERKNIPLSFTPIAIFPTSETVTESGRDLLERVFNTRVFDQYASSEGAPFVTECSAGSKHVELSTGVFENLPNSDEILVTSFYTHGTPLIRYRIGDTMTFQDTNNLCSCGANGPIVTNIGGRSDDYVVRADGVHINGGHVANLFKNMPNALIRAQVIQEEIGHITILLMVDKDIYQPNLDNLLRDEFFNTFGDTTKLTIHHVTEIPRETSGKFRLIKNKLQF